MRQAFALTVLFCMACTAARGGGEDLKSMEGVWSGIVVETSGKPAGWEFKDAKFKLIVKGDTYTILFNEKAISAGTMKLDPAKKPKSIDAMPKDGPHKDKVQPGIYEIKGDEMRVLFGEPEKARPQEFKTREGTMEVLLKYTRGKEVKK